MNAQVASDDIPRLEKILLTMEVGGQAAGFLNEQRASGNVPGLQMKLPEAIVATSRHIREVEGGRTGAAQTGGFLHQVFENRQIFVEMTEIAEGEARGNEAVIEFAALAHAQTPVVQVGATAATGGKEFARPEGCCEPVGSANLGVDYLLSAAGA